MHSDSASSGRGSPPARFRPDSPGSDTDRGPSDSWRSSASAIQSSSATQASQSSSAPVLRQPVGFGTSPPSVPTYQAPPSGASAATPQYLPGLSPAENVQSNTPTASSKSRRAANVDKQDMYTRKGKDLDSKVQPGRTPPYQKIQRTAFRVRGYANQPPATTVKEGLQDGPYGATYRAHLSDYARGKGNKDGASQGASTPRPPSYYYPWQNSESSQHPSEPSSHPPSQTEPSSSYSEREGSEPRPSYYRWDYDKLRETAPGFRAFAETTRTQGRSTSPPATASSSFADPPASASASRPIQTPAPTRTPAPRRSDAPTPAPAAYSAHASPPATHPDLPPPSPSQQYHRPNPQSTNPAPQHRSTHSEKRKQSDKRAKDVAPTAPSNYYPSQVPSPPPQPTFYTYPPPKPPPPPPSPPAPPQPQPTYSPPYSPVNSPPYPPPSPLFSHSSEEPAPSRSHRHEQTRHSSPPPRRESKAPPPPSREAPPPSARVNRVLTLLIEDQRGDSEDSMLAEVRVPLKPIEGGDEGYWADAQDVSEQLQKGPSRIDGAAKVYTKRGKYKQYFLRITDTGEALCQSANLKVASDRTLEIVIETNPAATARPVDKPTSSSSRGVQRGTATPVVSNRIPSPPPAPVASPPKRSSLFSIESMLSPDRDKFDEPTQSASAALEASRKRGRSASMQSIQSTRSEELSASSYPPSSAPSSAQFSPSASASGVISRTPSRTLPHQQQQRSHQAPVSPTSQSPRYYDTPQSNVDAYEDRSPRLPQAPPFPRIHTAFSPEANSMPFTTKPSSPKKPKLSTQSEHRDQSRRPVEDEQSNAYSWGSSRTASFGSSTSSAFSNTGSNPSHSPARSNPFERYGTSHNFSDRQTDTSRSAFGRTTGITLPSIQSFPSLSTVSASSSSTHGLLGGPGMQPATLAPSATSLAPTLSGPAASALDNTVGQYIKNIISKEPQWDAFVKNRTRVLKMSEQLEQYKYVQRVIDRFVNTTTPADLQGAGGVTITKSQVMRAFNLSLQWGEDCTETIVLTTLYGPGGTRGADPRVCALLEETPPITTGMQAKKYLALLREVHGQWTIAHPNGP